MKVIEQNNLRERVFRMLGQHEKPKVMQHFLEEGYSRRTLYSIFSRYKQGLSATGKKETRQTFYFR